MRRVMLGKSSQTLMPQKWEPSVQMGLTNPWYLRFGLLNRDGHAGLGRFSALPRPTQQLAKDG